MSGERGGHGVGPPSQSIGLETLLPRTDEQVTPSVAVHHPVGELRILIELQHKAPSCPDKRSLKWCTQKKRTVQ
jgi:hypothetical protein